MTIAAKGKAKVSGSDLLAGQDFTLRAKSATLDPGRDDSKAQETHDTFQQGLTVALSAPALTALQTVKTMKAAATRSKDPRVQALAAATGGLAVANAGSAMSAAGGMNVSVSATYGTSKSHSEATESSSVTSGSRVTAGRHATIITTGTGQDGDLSVIGSEIKAGAKLTLDVANDLHVSSGVDTHEQHSKSSSSSSSAGVAVTVGTSGASYGITGSLSMSKGKADGSGQSHSNSRLSAGQTVTLKTRGDANLRGAVVEGAKVHGQIGGNLNLESQQDTSSYRSDQQSLSVSATVGAGFSASGSFQKGKIESDFASVREQSGIHAGAGGFQLEVAGHTHLQGAVLSSSDQAVADTLNILKTRTLAVNALDNHSEASASSLGLSASVSREGDNHGNDKLQSFKDQDQIGAPSLVGAADSATSSSRSGISVASIVITDEAQQLERTGQTAQETLAGLNQTVRTGQDHTDALTDSFDVQALQASLDVAQAFGQEMGTFLSNKAAKADQLAKAKKSGEVLDPAQAAQLERELAAAQTWAPGGTSRQLATALSAAVTGNVSAGTTQVLQSALVSYVQQKGAALIGDLVHGTNGKPGVLREGSAEHAALHAMVAAAGATASGQDVLSGASGAAASSLLTNLFSEDPTLTASEKEARRDLMTTLVAGMAGVLDQDAGTAAGAAHNALDNNFLTLGNPFGGVASSLGDAWQEHVSDPIERLNNKVRGIGWVEDRYLQDELNLIAATDPIRARELADLLERDQFIASLPLISCGGLAPVGLPAPTFTFQLPGGPTAPAVATNGTAVSVPATSAITIPLPGGVVTMSGSGGRQKQDIKNTKQAEPKKEAEPKLEATPLTSAQKFQKVKGTKAFRNTETGEIWEKDMLHKNHYEVYKNKKMYDKGVRTRTTITPETV